VLFLPYRANEIATLRSLISTWMRLAIFETMSQPEGDQRLWFVIDELDALGAIDSLKDALARLRKFGGRCVLGFQSIAQVSGTYGHAEGHDAAETTNALQGGPESERGVRRAAPNKPSSRTAETPSSSAAPPPKAAALPASRTL
jgi:hypothetical protein